MGIRIGDKMLEMPILQGGMGIGVSLGGLAGAVSAEGGMGTISMVGIGYREPDFYKNFTESCIRAFKKELQKAKELASGRGLIAVNLMAVVENYEAMEQAVMDSDADALVVGAGLPLNLPKKNHKKKLLAPIVSGRRALELICRSWKRRYDVLPDFVVLEGKGAGGHLGFSLEDIEDKKVKLTDLARDVAEYLKSVFEEYGKQIPFFVAGSVMDRNDLTTYTEIGAAGLQLGTRFLATEESDAHIHMKRKIVESRSEDLTIIKSPVGIYGRAIRNEFLKRLEEGRLAPKRCINCLTPCDPKTTEFCISERLILTAQGDVEQGLVFCGSRVDEVNDIIPVRKVFEDLSEVSK